MIESITFGQWLHAKRKAKMLTFRKLSEEVGVASPYLQQIETDLVKPSEELAHKLIEYFNELDVEGTMFLARKVLDVLKDIKQKYPTISAKYLNTEAFNGIISEE